MFRGVERTNLFSTYTMPEHDPLEQLTCHYWLQKNLRANASPTDYENIRE